MYISSLIKR